MDIAQVRQINQIKMDITNAVMKAFEDHFGNEFYCAGGAPRDWYFDKPVNDIDLYTDNNSPTSAYGKALANLTVNGNRMTIDSIQDIESKYIGMDNDAIRKVYRIQLSRRDSSGRMDGFNKVDIIQMKKLNGGFNDIFASYDYDMCMIGYKDGYYHPSIAFENFEKSGATTIKKNRLTKEALLKNGERVHFPKIEAKYPGIKLEANPSLVDYFEGTKVKELLYTSDVMVELQKTVNL